MGVILSLIAALVLYVPVLVAVAFLTLAERKTLGFAQLRRGPAVVGPTGLLQPMADGVKLFSKKTIIPAPAWGLPFLGAPCLGLTLALLVFFFIDWPGSGPAWTGRVGVLFIVAIAGLSIYAILIGAWASRSRYALLGGLRAAAQMISYEILISILLLTITVLWASASPSALTAGQTLSGPLILPLLPLAVAHFIALLAETNRAPFDLAEGESELVSGFNVEYSASAFSLFSLAEYGHMVLGSVLWALLYWGGGLRWGVPAVAACGTLLWVRASFPRIRYDLLMSSCWNSALPTLLVALPLVYWVSTV